MANVITGIAIARTDSQSYIDTDTQVLSSSVICGIGAREDTVHIKITGEGMPAEIIEGIKKGDLFFFSGVLSVSVRKRPNDKYAEQFFIMASYVKSLMEEEYART